MGNGCGRGLKQKNQDGICQTADQWAIKAYGFKTRRFSALDRFDRI